MDADAIVSQLRELHMLGADGPMKEAADLIDHLMIEVDRLRESYDSLVTEAAAEHQRLNDEVNHWVAMSNADDVRHRRMAKLWAYVHDPNVHPSSADFSPDHLRGIQ